MFAVVPSFPRKRTVLFTLHTILRGELACSSRYLKSSIVIHDFALDFD